MIIAVSQRDNPRRYSTKSFQIRVNSSPSVNSFQIRSFVPPGEEELESLGIVLDPNGVPYKIEILDNADLEDFLTAFTSGKIVFNLRESTRKSNTIWKSIWKHFQSRIHLENRFWIPHTCVCYEWTDECSLVNGQISEFTTNWYCHIHVLLDCWWNTCCHKICHGKNAIRRWVF